MSRFEITNPNGSLVFVRGTRVAPFAKFSANLDQASVQELKKYGVSVTPILVSDTPTESLVVEVAPLLEVKTEDLVGIPEPAAEEPVAIEEAPLEEAPVEAAPIEEAPVEAAPVEAAPIEEAPVEEAPVELPVDGRKSKKSRK